MYNVSENENVHGGYKVITKQHIFEYMIGS